MATLEAFAAEECAVILVVDDDRALTALLVREIGRRGYHARAAHTGEEALDLALRLAPDLIFLDVRLDDMSGLDVLSRLRAARSDVDVVIMTGHPELASAVAAVKSRAADYLCKPFSLKELDGILQRLRPVPAGGPGRVEGGSPAAGDGGGVFLGVSPATARLRTLVGQLAAGGIRAALVTGESGTGKDLVARLLHAQSPRRSGPFVGVNCSAVSESLFESEFYGHEKGSFTGAVASQRGLVELADGGTLFLDELGDMPRSCQAKLLRFLDDQSFRRVGGRETIRVDVQLVAATNCDLRVLVAEQKFREDLYFRLNVAPIHVPPLRERVEDIPVLAAHFVTGANHRYGKAVRGLSREAEAELVAYRWPGNVRELRNVVERLVILCPAREIGADQIPDEYRPRPAAAAGGPAAAANGPGASGPEPAEGAGPRSLAEIEREHILQVLEQVQGNKTRAAEILGISRQTLRAKLALLK